jgi:hypothetical protein
MPPRLLPCKARGLAKRAAQDRTLFDRVAAHREIFFRWSWVDYTTLHPGALRFLPPAHRVDAWRKDYQEMRGEMFFGEVPAFDEILRAVGDFEKRFNQTQGSDNLAFCRLCLVEV